MCLFGRSVFSSRSAAILTLALAGASCATLPFGERDWIGGRCDFVVFNRTGSALDVRLLRERSTRVLGALNPGELLTDRVSCAEQYVWISGTPIPMQVGAPVGRSVYGWAELVRGERAIVSLGLQ
jgi:hypothetical protein